jgi:hypothetical protein
LVPPDDFGKGTVVTKDNKATGELGYD